MQLGTRGKTAQQIYEIRSSSQSGTKPHCQCPMSWIRPLLPF
jgi:hypothetical protein